MNNQKIENLELNTLNKTSPLVTGWNILEVLKDEIYLELKPEFIVFIRDEFKKRKLTQKFLAKQLNTWPSTVNSWLNNLYKIPYPAIIKSLEILNIDKTILTKNINGIALSKGHVKIYNPNLLIKFDANFARFLGHIYGDGSVRGNFTVSFTNLNQDLTNDFIICAKNIFGNVNCYIYKGEDSTTNITLPKLIGIFLTRCFKGIQKKIIPIDYLLLNQSNIKEFIGSLFDGEGHVSIKKGQLEILLSKLHMLEDLKILFETINISTSAIHQKIDKRNGIIYYRINIYRRKNIQKFYELIKLKHKYKTESIWRLLSNYSRKYVDYELKEAILAELAKKPLTSSELVTLLKGILSSICKCLVKLEKLEIVTKEKIYRKGINKERYAINLWSLK